MGSYIISLTLIIIGLGLNLQKYDMKSYTDEI